MKIRLFCLVLMSVFLHLSYGAPHLVVPERSKVGKENGNDFKLVTNSSVVDLLVDSNDSKTVLLATRLFSEDIERVSGQKARIKNDAGSVSPLCVINPLSPPRTMLSITSPKKQIPSNMLSITSPKKQIPSNKSAGS